HVISNSYADLIPSGTSDSPFKPGMSATADIQVKSAKHILSLPIEAVTTRSNKDTLKLGDEGKKDKSKSTSSKSSTEKKDTIEECVFVYDNTTKKVKKVIVTTGVQDADYIEIKT